MSKWYQDKSGDDSSLRLMAVPGAWAGILIVLVGAVGVFLKVPESIGLAGVGSGLFSVASGVKAWQKGKEV